MDGGTARPDVKRRVTRAAPLARQGRVLPTDGKLLLVVSVLGACMSLLVLSVPRDYVPSSWSVDDGSYGTTASCRVCRTGCLTRSGADHLYMTVFQLAATTTVDMPDKSHPSSHIQPRSSPPEMFDRDLPGALGKQQKPLSPGSIKLESIYLPTACRQLSPALTAESHPPARPIETPPLSPV